MSVPRLILSLLLGLAALPGCDRGPGPAKKSPASRPEDLAACLPDGITLSTPLTQGGAPHPTVAEKLKELGAYAEGGKLFDSSGREIVFRHRFISGVQPNPDWERQRAEQERQEKDELEKLKAKYTVIELVTYGV